MSENENSPIERLIQQLGSERYKLRGEAAKELRNHPEAIPYLQRAQRSADLEIAQQANRLLKHFEPLLNRQAIERAQRWFKNGRLDLGIEQLLAIRPADRDAAYWNSLIVAGFLCHEKTLPASNSVGSLLRVFPSRYFSSYDDGKSLLDLENATFKNSPRLVRGANIKCDDANASLVVLNGSLDLNRFVQKSMVFTTGSVRTRQFILGSIVVADDAVEAGFVRDSLIIARKSVKKLGLVSNSIILCSGEIERKKLFDAVRMNNYLQDNDPNLLGFIQWFETSQIGIEAVQQDRTLQISKLALDKEFAKAGCKLGDRVLAVDDTNLGLLPLDEFRRALRKATIVGQTKLSLLRGKEKIELTVTIRVRFPEDA